MRNRVAVSAALLIAVLLGACSQTGVRLNASATETDPSEGEPAPEGERLAEAIKSSRAVGVTLSPPAGDAAAKVSADDARKALAAVFGESRVRDLTPNLAVLDNEVMGEIQEDGSVIPYYVDRLVWAFVGYEDCPPPGARDLGNMPDEELPRPPVPDVGTTPNTCIDVLNVDAVTGEYLMGYSASKDARAFEDDALANNPG